MLQRKEPQKIHWNCLPWQKLRLIDGQRQKQHLLKINRVAYFICDAIMMNVDVTSLYIQKLTARSAGLLHIGGIIHSNQLVIKINYPQHQISQPSWLPGKHF